MRGVWISVFVQSGASSSWSGQSAERTPKIMERERFFHSALVYTAKIFTKKNSKKGDFDRKFLIFINKKNFHTILNPPLNNLLGNLCFRAGITQNICMPWSTERTLKCWSAERTPDIYYPPERGVNSGYLLYLGAHSEMLERGENSGYLLCPERSALRKKTEQNKHWWILLINGNFLNWKMGREKSSRNVFSRVKQVKKPSTRI